MRSPTATTATTAWSLVGHTATLTAGRRGVRLDLAAAERGLSLESADASGDAVLGIDLCGLTDQWARGSDVVAVYEPADQRRLRATAMWRCGASVGEVVAWEVIVSAQTASLETQAVVAVRSVVTADEVRWSTAAGDRWHAVAHDGRPPSEALAFIARRSASSWLIAVHPADAREITLSRAGGAAHMDCRLFASPLEKGVLLRSRVLAAIGPATDDEAWAARLLEAFAASPPPLTT
ncbi:MAG: hypothetical protein ACKO4T_07550 [Planctomycetaceae bacterium]